MATATMAASGTVKETRKRAVGRTALERILWVGLFVQGSNERRGLPYCLVGKPSTAKSATLRWLARMAGLHFEAVISSLRDPSDFLGLGVPHNIKLDSSNQHLSPDGDETFMLMKYAPAAFAVRAAIAKRALINLDEVNTAPPAVQAALLRMLFEGVCGELELPTGVRQMLAMNAVEDAAGGYDIAAPLANRVGWLPFPEPTVARFNDYMMGAGGAQQAPVNAAQEEAEVDAQWPSAWARAAGEVCGFLTAKSDMLHKMPPSGSKAVSEAWAAPRTWELATRAKAGGYIYDLSAIEIDQSITAFVGAAAAGMFHTWTKNNDLPDPADLLDGHVAFHHDPKRLDRTAAILTSATSLVVQNAKGAQLGTGAAALNAQRSEVLWKIHETMAAQAPDLSLGSVVGLCTSKLMIGSATAYRVLAKMEPIMSAAGITPEMAGRP